MLNISGIPIDSSLIFAIAVIVFVIVIIVKAVTIVSQSDLYVIERLGSYNKTLNGGLNLIIPIIDSVRATITAREQIINIPKQSVITKDNVSITIDGIVFCKVTDAKDATYKIVDFKDAIGNLAMTTLRSQIGGMELDETLSNRDSLNTAVQTALDEAAAEWGVKITRVEISEISVPESIEKAMSMQMEAEREKRAIETKAKADKEAVIRNAEGRKQETVLEAEAKERMADALKYEQKAIAVGQQEAMNVINEAMKDNPKAAEFLLAKDRIAAFHALASSSSTDKMILPYDVTQMIGSTSVLGDAFFKGVSNGSANTN